MASLNPLLKLRDDLVKVRLVERGEVIYMYRVPETQNYYRIDEMQHEILSLLDGTRTMEGVVRDFNAKNLLLPLDEEFLETYLENLREAEIFEKTAEEKKVLFLEKVRDQRRRTAGHKSSFGNILDIKLSAWNPDSFFERVLPYMRFIFTPGFVIFSAACMLVMLGIWAADWDRIKSDTLALFSFEGKTGADLLQFFLILFVVGFIHESAHGLTCKYFGGQVRQMGFLLMFFTPCFYVDVSDAYMLDRHSRRQWVIFAGGYIEMFICSLSTFVWALTSPGTLVNDLSYKVLLMTGLISIILNYNPFIKLDGYYSLMDFLEITDLWERSFGYVSDWIKKTIFRLPVEIETPPKKVRRIFVIYCLGSVAYKILLIAVFLVFFKNILFGLFGEFAWVALALVILLVFRKPLIKLAGLVKFTILDKKEVFMKPRYLLTITGVSGLLLAGFTLLPVPIVVRGHFVLEPASRAIVRPSVVGTIERVLVSEGQTLRPGETLAILRNDPLTRRIPVLEGRLSLCAQEIAEASDRGERALLGKKLMERDLLREQLRMLYEKTDALTLRAPISGVVTTARLSDLEGAYLDVGDTFCEIAGADGMIARVPIREWRLDEIRPGQQVDLKMTAYPFRTFSGSVIDLAPASSGNGMPGQEAKTGAAPKLTDFPEFTDFEVIVRLEDGSGSLRHGMAGVARIRLGRSTLARRTARAARRWYNSRVW